MPFLLCAWNFKGLFVKMGRDSEGWNKLGLLKVLPSDHEACQAPRDEWHRGVVPLWLVDI